MSFVSCLSQLFANEAAGECSIKLGRLNHIGYHSPSSEHIQAMVNILEGLTSMMPSNSHAATSMQFIQEHWASLAMAIKRNLQEPSCPDMLHHAGCMNTNTQRRLLGKWAALLYAWA